jgi:uncharacterized GH25 family protein
MLRIFLFFVFLSIEFSLAHDYWLQPKKFVLSKDDTLVVHLYVGDRLKKEIERELQKDMTLKFEILTDTKSVNLLDEFPDKMLPVIQRKVDFEGPALILMERSYAYIELNRKDFLEYIKHDVGKKELGEIKRLLRKFPQREIEKEKYTRYIKSLIVSEGNFDSDIYKKILDQKLEIVLLNNPYKLRPGDNIEAKILFEGKPLANKTVMGYNFYEGKYFEYRARTDKEGRVKFKVKNPGLWLIRLTHILPCTNCSDADWESFWASFSFWIPTSP